MVIMILERVPTSLRGELTRWLIEPKAGVFVGNVNAMVRERLWQQVIKGSRTGGCVLIHSAESEQGFAMEFYGETKRTGAMFEGLQLVRIPLSELSSQIDPETTTAPSGDP